ncbi:hypothetical protein KBD34_00570 [Patescibacteria group bacterium]|nr:hypothetical protein [Patescibacteria group bacterium]
MPAHLALTLAVGALGVTEARGLAGGTNVGATGGAVAAVALLARQELGGVLALGVRHDGTDVMGLGRVGHGTLLLRMGSCVVKWLLRHFFR